MHMVSEKDLNSAELETMGTSKNPTTVMTANKEVQTREEATVYVKQLDLFVKVLLLEETPTVLSLGKLCEDHGVIHTTGPEVKNHISSEMAREWIATNPTVYHLWFLVYQRVLPQLHLHLVLHHLHHRIPYLMSTEVRMRTYGETRCIDQQKPETLIKMEDAKKYKAIYCMTCRIGYRNSKRIWLMNEILQSHGETLSLDIETLPSHFMNFQWSREQQWNRVRVSTVSILTSRRTVVVTSA